MPYSNDILFKKNQFFIELLSNLNDSILFKQKIDKLPEDSYIKKDIINVIGIDLSKNLDTYNQIEEILKKSLIKKQDNINEKELDNASNDLLKYINQNNNKELQL